MRRPVLHLDRLDTERRSLTSSALVQTYKLGTTTKSTSALPQLYALICLTCLTQASKRHPAAALITLLPPFAPVLSNKSELQLSVSITSIVPVLTVSAMFSQATP